MPKEIQLANKKAGGDNPCLIIAELSANHHQDLEQAKKLVKTACEVGADVVKIQTYTPDTMTLDSTTDPFQVKINKAWKNKTLHQLYKIAQTPWGWYEELEKVAREYDVPLIGTPYDLTSVDFLESKNCPFYKVASFEATDIQFLKKVALTKKPVIISRGMTTFEEISQAISVLKEFGASEIILLHCVSAYPSVPKDLNILAVVELQKKFPDLVVGLSEHSIKIAPAVATIALGAKVIERHLILKREDGGPDAAFSLEPKEFSEMVKEIREVEQALGDGILEPVPAEIENKQFRRSLWAIKEIKQGEELTKENVGSFRPSTGLKPADLPKVIGKKAKQDIPFATPLNWDLID